MEFLFIVRVTARGDIAKGWSAVADLQGIAGWAAAYPVISNLAQASHVVDVKKKKLNLLPIPICGQ